MTESFTTISAKIPPSVTLVAVSKMQPLAAVMALYDAGQRVFAENRVQEAEGKFAALKAADPALKLHLIGALQTNKVKKAAALFDVIETLDRPALADELAKQPRCPDLLIQVNLGAEPQKSGVSVEDFPALLAYCQKLHLPVVGVMCIPPATQDPTPYFKQLAALAHAHHLPRLSMGMSADFETAIHCGATHVRIGSALFGVRTR